MVSSGLNCSLLEFSVYVFSLDCQSNKLVRSNKLGIESRNMCSLSCSLYILLYRVRLHFIRSSRISDMGHTDKWHFNIGMYRYIRTTNLSKFQSSSHKTNTQVSFDQLK